MIAAGIAWRPLGARATGVRATRPIVACAALALIALAPPMMGAAAARAVAAPLAAYGIERQSNDVRAQHGLPPLAPSDTLTSVARDYARLLAVSDAFGHIGPDASTVATRAEARGYVSWSALAENLATGPGVPDARTITEAWMLSPTHRRNMLAPDLQEAAASCYVTRTHPHRYWCVLELGAATQRTTPP